MRLNVFLGGLAAVNLLMGLLIQWCVVTRLGIGTATDALFAGMAVPQVVLTILSGSLVFVLVPLLAGEPEAAFADAARVFFVAVTATFAILSAALILSASVWLRWLLPGFSPPVRALAVELTRIQLVGMVFMAALAVLSSVFYARHQFLRAEWAIVGGSAVSLLILVGTIGRFGAHAAAWASVVRYALPVLVLFPGLGRWARVSWRTVPVREGWRRLRPLLLGSAYYKTDPLVDRYLSSLSPAGGLSVLFVSQQLWGAASQIIQKAIAAPLVPTLSAQAKRGEWAAFRRTLNRRLGWMLALSTGGFLLFLAVGAPALHLVIGHGGVTKENADWIWRVMVALGGILIAGSAGQVTSGSYYALGDTKTPTWIGVATYTVYVPLKVGAFFAFGLTGLCVVTSVYYAINLLLQWRGLRHRVGPPVPAAG